MNIFMKKQRNQKILVSLIISYILVLIVPFTVNRISYISVEKSLMEEVKNYNAEYLHGRAQTLDATISNVSDMADSIFLNEDFREAASLSAPLTTQERYKLSTDKSYIYGGFDFYIENVFVILKNADYYVGQNGTGNLKNFYNAHYGKTFSSYDEWYEFMTEYYYGELVVYSPQNAKGNGSVFYAISYTDVGDDSNLLANVIVEFKKSFLLSANTEKNTFFLTDANNEIILCNKDESFINSANEALRNVENDNVVYMQHGGLKKVMLIQKMWQSDFKYVSCITEDVFMEKIVHMRRNYMYSLFICILIGGITICWAIKIHYMPIKRITKALSQNFEYDSGLNEYQYLMSVVSKIASEYQTNSQYKELEKRLARNSFLLSVLKGEELLNDIFSRLGYFGVSFKNHCFCVVAINLEDCSKLFFEQEESEDNLGLAKLIIINVMEDMVKDKFELAFCENGDEIFMLISLLNSGQMQELQERLSETQKLIESLSNVHLFMSVSAAYEDFKNISVCYREAVELIRYCRIRNERFLTYSDNAQLNNGEIGQYIYSADVEQKLISYLTYGNYEKSSMLLQEILNNNLKNENAASIKVRCLVFDIIATVFKVIRQNENVSKTVDIEKTDLLIVIDDFESVAFVQEELLKVFKQICDNVKVNPLSPSEKLSDSIIEFVKTNYNNQNLNVAYISEKFNVSANYVSSVFKREKGIPLSEYISAVRIGHAGELLKTTNLKVAEIAEEVGFASLRTFSRVFNSVVGISPIEYRKNK